MHLVQVCNVGQICGGTAACAWTVRQALPNWRHTQLCFSRPATEMRRAFEGSCLRQISRVDQLLIDELQPDLLMFHNSSPDRVDEIRGCPTLSYLHSAGPRVSAARTVACSEWLARQQSSPTTVLYQPVPVPIGRPQADRRHLDDSVIIGRMCTPIPQKWPPEAVALAARITAAYPQVRWELVGCPDRVQREWVRACRGKVRFLPAGWEARQNLWRWHALLYHHPHITESFGRTAAEAMRVGCIPIVDARGGFLEQVTSGETGFLCSSDEDFLSAVETIHQRGMRWRIRRQAKQSADDRFSLRSFASRFYTILRG